MADFILMYAASQTQACLHLATACETTTPLLAAELLILAKLK